MSKHKIKIAQWYISHTCNLSCKNCLSFNNFNIAGHERWEDNEDYVQQWSKLVEIDDLSIIGGEPLSNPDLNLWIDGIHTYFNNQSFKICTNGTQLEKWKTHLPAWPEKGAILEIHTHDKAHLSNTWKILTQAYGKDITYVKGSDYHNDYKYCDWVGVVNNNVAVLQTNDMSFLPWGVKGKNQQGEYEFYETNPKNSHRLCMWNNCHYFYRGDMYKCGTLVGAQEFVNKYPVREDHKNTILDYKPVRLGSNNLAQDLENLKSFVPQCGLCNYASRRMWLDATQKKEK